LRAITLAGVTVAVAVHIWAWLPLRSDPVAAPSLSAPQQSEAPTDSPDFQAGAFDVALWRPPAVDRASAEASENRAAPPPPRVTLQLVGMIREGDSLAAALYDPGAGKLVTAREGETVAGHEVTTIDLTGVDLSVGGRAVHLPLNQDRIAKAQAP